MQQIPETTVRVVFRKETWVEGITGTFIIETPGLEAGTMNFSQPPNTPRFNIIAPIENICDALSTALDYAHSKDRDDSVRLIQEFMRDLESDGMAFAEFVVIAQLAEACTSGMLYLAKWSEDDIAVWLARTARVVTDIANQIGYGVEDDDQSSLADDVCELATQLAQFWTVKRAEKRRALDEMTYTVEEVEALEEVDTEESNEPEPGCPAHQLLVRDAAANWARTLLNADDDFVILDLETTGLYEDAEICQIGLLSSGGEVLMNQLVKPTEPIPTTATNIHGITDDMVLEAPTFDAVYSHIEQIVKGKAVVIFNRAFDMRVLNQVCVRNGLASVLNDCDGIHCAMLKYADFRGEWNDYHGNYRWPKLAYAINEFKIDLSDGKEHDAMTDCRITLALIEGMAHYAQPQTDESGDDA